MNENARVEHMPDRIERGRNVRDGYQRGWGLQFDKLADRIAKEPLFGRAYQLAQGRTVVAPYNLINLYLIIQHFLGRLESQDIIEFGSYRGGSAVFMAWCLKKLYPGAKIYALDTFEGMPETEDVDWHKPGDFGGPNIEEICDFADQAGLDNLVFVKGRFQDTLPILLKSVRPFGLAHIDCDTYAAVKYCQDTMWDQMSKGGYLVYDDALVSSCFGATQAVEELIMERRVHCEQIWPHAVFRVGLQS
jgi:predicted O-methyltransferase YrrM